MHCGIFRCEILIQCVDESPNSLLEKIFRFSGFNYPSVQSSQNQPWSVNGTHLTIIQTNQNAENVNRPPRSKFLPPTQQTSISLEKKRIKSSHKTIFKRFPNNWTPTPIQSKITPFICILTLAERAKEED